MGFSRRCNNCDIPAAIQSFPEDLSRHGISIIRHMPATSFTYRDLDVWKQGMDLVEESYRATASFPKSELYGLTSQLRRAAVSIPANVAEGHSHKSTRVYLNHLSIAIGSHSELETCIELGFRLGFLASGDRNRVMTTCDSVGRLLSGLYRALARKIGGGFPSP
jgi:four helix bundle protein